MKNLTKEQKITIVCLLIAVFCIGFLLGGAFIEILWKNENTISSPDTKILERNEVKTEITETSNTQIDVEPEEEILIEKYEGIVEVIDGNTIHYRDIKNSKINKTELTAEEKIFNAVTEEEMTLNQITVGDYIFKNNASENNVKVARNIFGDELKNEIFKELIQKPLIKGVGIESVEYRNSNKEALVTFEAEPSYYKEFGREMENFEFKFIVNKDTEIHSRTGIDFLTLEERTSNMGWIKIRGDTINNQCPIVEILDIYEG